MDGDIATDLGTKCVPLPFQFTAARYHVKRHVGGQTNQVSLGTPGPLTEKEYFFGLAAAVFRPDVVVLV
jgi:hypothetical protein